MDRPGTIQLFCRLQRCETFYILFARAGCEANSIKRFSYEMFYYMFQEDRAGWYQGAVLPDTKTFQLRQRQMSVSLPMGQRQNLALGLLRSGEHPRTAASHGSLARRSVGRPCLVQSQNAVAPPNASCLPRPRSQQETEIFLPRPLIDLPDPEGFYAGLVLRKIRARLQSRWELSKGDGSSLRRNTVDRPTTTQMSSEVTRCGTGSESLETLLVEIARRHAQTPVFGGGSS